MNIILPKPNEPGSFGYMRKYDYHTGVDIYCKEGTEIFAIEEGVVIGIGDFTGSSVGSPWWNETKYVMVKGSHGVINYAEIEPFQIKIDDKISKHQKIGIVVPVLKDGKNRLDIPNHSRWMLHLELYDHWVKEPMEWHHGQPCPSGLQDPMKLQNVLSSLYKL